MITVKVKTPDEIDRVWVERKDLQSDDLVWAACSRSGPIYQMEVAGPVTPGSGLILDTDRWFLIEVDPEDVVA